MSGKMKDFQQQIRNESDAILEYWLRHSIDEVNGGFYGRIDETDIADPRSIKGVVLNARILWTFSAAYNHTGKEVYLQTARRAFHYILDHFIDREFGGVYWSLDAKGLVFDGKKQVYGQAFVLYGLSEYYLASKEDVALNEATQLYQLIEARSHDKINDGYEEAFARDWSAMDDLRLSIKDVNEKKTANTHLHVIEAYANLYRAWPQPELAEHIAGLLNLFHTRFINPNDSHLKLFFNEKWIEKPDVISYGHDIEAAWLLLQCAETIADEYWTRIFQQHAVTLCNAAMRGLDKDGGLWYEYNQASRQLIKEKHWWPQAEALVGFINAYTLSGDHQYFQKAIDNWHFITRHIIDKENGEWYWGIDENNTVMPGQDKAGFWKCPYHNTRACIELDKRLFNLIHT